MTRTKTQYGFQVLIIAALINSTSVIAQSPVEWAFVVERTVTDGATVTMKATMEDGWHIYAMELPRDDGPLPTLIEVQANEAIALVGEVREPEPEEVDDPNFMMLVRYHSDSVAYEQDVKLLNSSVTSIEGSVEFMVCNDKTCLPPERLPFSISLGPIAKEVPDE